MEQQVINSLLFGFLLFDVLGPLSVFTFPPTSRVQPEPAVESRSKVARIEVAPVAEEAVPA
jgi:hypothetical protein